MTQEQLDRALKIAITASLLVLACFLCLVLLSYQVQDTSFVYAADEGISNLGGALGAHIAGVLWLCLGYSALILPLALVLEVVRLHLAPCPLWAMRVLAWWLLTLTVSGVLSLWHLQAGGLFGILFAHLGASLLLGTMGLVFLAGLVWFLCMYPRAKTDLPALNQPPMPKVSATVPLVDLMPLRATHAPRISVQEDLWARFLSQMEKDNASLTPDMLDVDTDDDPHTPIVVEDVQTLDASLSPHALDAQSIDAITDSHATDGILTDNQDMIALARQNIACMDNAFSNPSSAILQKVPKSPAEPSAPDINDLEGSLAFKTARHRQDLPALPRLELLDPPAPQVEGLSGVELVELSSNLESKLKDFGIDGKVVDAICGPVVTSFHVDLAPGIKASKVSNVARDLARSLAMPSMRVVEAVAGKPYISLEIPNPTRQTISLIELLTCADYQDNAGNLSIAIGKGIEGDFVISDLQKAPHMLVAGQTGSGKSVFINCLLMSLLLKYTPDYLRFILIDPKQLEMVNYEEIPHLLAPPVTNMDDAPMALEWAVGEMERRYHLMSLFKIRQLDAFNQMVDEANAQGKPLLDPTYKSDDRVTAERIPRLGKLPYVVIVVDEFADLIMQLGKPVEDAITRLAQKARACGIHLILATQRPTVNVITGLIKANFPVRVAGRVISRTDSRTILDEGGAEDMLGNGDMLFLAPGALNPIRIHGAYVKDQEVNRVCDAWRARGAPDYVDLKSESFELADDTPKERDKLYDDALAYMVESGNTSISMLQRKFGIGYNRAARIVDQMESAGVISPMDHNKNRRLLI